MHKNKLKKERMDIGEKNVTNENAHKVWSQKRRNSRKERRHKPDLNPLAPMFECLWLEDEKKGAVSQDTIATMYCS